MIYGVKCFLKINKDSNCVLIIFKTLIYIVDKLKNGHISGMVLSKAVLVMIKNIKFNKKIKKSGVKQFL